MEYLNGGDLYSLLQKVGCLDDDIARIYIAELVSRRLHMGMVCGILKETVIIYFRFLHWNTSIL